MPAKTILKLLAKNHSKALQRRKRTVAAEIVKARKSA